MPETYGPPVKTAPRILWAALLLPLLAGCDAIYDDTKGWANRLEASILNTAHEIGEPQPDAEAEKPAMAPAMAASETPPAVPVEPVDTVALPAPGMAPQAMAEDTTPPALSAPGMAAAPMPALSGSAPGGLMAEAAGSLLTPAPPEPAKPGMAAKPAEAPQQAAARATPPPPKAKPAQPVMPAKAAGDAPKAGGHDTDVHEKPAMVETKAAEAKAADPAVAVVLHLSSLRSEDAAKREWSDLQHSFPEPLGGMAAEFRRTDLGDKGTYYRVLAGPLPTRDAARQVCASLKAKDAKQYCRIMPSKPAS